MNHRNLRLLASCVFALVVAGAARTQESNHDAMDHSGHHNITQEEYELLRARVLPYRNYTTSRVGYLLSTRGIQHKIPVDFAGLDFTFNEKGLSAHPDFASWVETNALETASRL